MQRDEMLEKAANVLSVRPTATMDEIAEAIGVSRATLFRHVESREALVTDLCQSAAANYEAAVSCASPTDGSASEALVRVVRGLAALGPGYGMLALQPLPPEVEAQLLAQTQAADEQIRSVVRRGQRNGEFETHVPPEWVLTAMIWLVVGAADGVRLGRLAPKEAPRLVEETIMRALKRDSHE